MKSWLALSTSALLCTTLIGCGGSSNSDNTPDPQPPAVVTPDSVTLTFLGRYSTGEFKQSAAEIPAYDAASQRAFVVNARKGALDVLDMADPANPTLIATLTVADIAADAVVNSVAVQNGLVAVAIEANPKTEPGFMALYRAEDLALLGQVQVGAQPDMLIFTANNHFVLVANEGEPSDDYQIDPEGSVSIVDIRDLDNLSVRTADFRAFNDRKDELVAAGVRIFGPGASVAEDLEPEYIAVSADSQRAWVMLQENNAFALLDIDSATVTDIVPLGFVDRGVAGFGFDASDKDEQINIRTWPGVMGIYHPDAIKAYEVNGETYIVTANEGDARAWGEDNDAYWAVSDDVDCGDPSQGFVEEIRVKHLVHSSGFDRRCGDDMPPQLRALAAGALLNPDVFGYCGAAAGEPGDCREDELLGRLKVTWTEGYRKDAEGNPLLFNALGEEDPAGDRLMYDNLYAFGARSFAIWNAEGELVWESADQIEQYLASDACMLGRERTIPCADFFNSNHNSGNAFDTRSDDKGPEPEGVEIAAIGDKQFLFLGLERMGGVMVYDITDPQAPTFVDYLNTREEWLVDPEAGNLEGIGDLGAEGLVFVPAADSANGEALLIVGNEVSGTTSVYQVENQFK